MKERCENCKEEVERHEFVVLKEYTWNKEGDQATREFRLCNRCCNFFIEVLKEAVLKKVEE